jgi:phage terminase large subunit-like protein
MLQSTTTTTKKQKVIMSATQAKTFNHFSEQNTAIVESVLKCGCIPYVDVFTFDRWKAQGFIVRLHEHGIKLPVIIQDEKTKDNGDKVIKKFVHRTPVFVAARS